MKQHTEKRVNRNIRLNPEQVKKEQELMESYGIDTPSFWRMLLTEKHREIFSKKDSTNTAA